MHPRTTVNLTERMSIPLQVLEAMDVIEHELSTLKREGALDG